jgi:hypothetical protein
MKKYYLLGLSLVFAFYSCNDTSDPTGDLAIIINSNSESLTARVKLDNAGVIGLIDPNAPGGRIQEDVDAGDIVTNAVSVDNNLLFMANGAAGISISDVSDLASIKSFGVLDLDGSSNFVRNEEEFVFVATGFGGLQILKINKSEGTTDVSCEGLPSYKGNANLNINTNESQS